MSDFKKYCEQEVYKKLKEELKLDNPMAVPRIKKIVLNVGAGEAVTNKGFLIGVKVTLRGKNMYFFLEKLIKIVIPRFRDFRGISDSNIDQHGNLNLGLTEQTIFPEIEYDKVDKMRGLQVTVVTNAKDKIKGKKLFETLGIPFKA